MTRTEAAHILGISPQANLATIKKAFRKKAMKLHPDKNKAENAKSQFIQIHEAYEYLSDLAAGRSTKTYSKTRKSNYATPKSKFRSAGHKHRHYADPYEHMTQEEFEERYNRARKAAEENQNRKSEAIHSSAFEEYKTTWRRSFLMYMAGLGVILFILFTTDYFLGTIKEYIPQDETEITKISDSKYDYYYLNIHHVKYSLPNNARYFIKNYKVNYRIERTHIFKDIVGIRIEYKNHFLDLKPSYSSFGSFPLIPLIMLIPLLSFLMEKPSFNFVFFGVYFNIYVFPIFTLILLFHDGRLLRLFGL